MMIVRLKTFITRVIGFIKNFIDPLLDGDSLTKRLVIIPDEALSHLSFESFVTEEPKPNNPVEYSNLPYLLYDYSISYDLSALTWSFRQKVAPKKNEMGIIALTNSFSSRSEFNYISANTAKQLSEVDGLRAAYKGDF